MKQPSLKSNKQYRILVADDDLITVSLARMILEQGGFEVVTARNGVDAWKALENSSFDAVVLDYQMPGMTGEEVARKARAELTNPDLPIIVMTARGFELSVDQLTADLGIKKILHKPISPHELITAVLQALTVQ